MVRAGRNILSLVSNASFNTIGVTYATGDTGIGIHIDFWELKKGTNKIHCYYGKYICNCISSWEYKKKTKKNRLTVVDLLQ